MNGQFHHNNERNVKDTEISNEVVDLIMEENNQPLNILA